jgi:hypothetical protein
VQLSFHLQGIFLSLLLYEPDLDNHKYPGCAEISQCTSYLPPGPLASPKDFHLLGKMSSQANVYVERIFHFVALPDINTVACSSRRTKPSLKSSNLNKLPSSHPIREYFASDEGRFARLAATDMARDGNGNIDDLDSFMQQLTDKNIVNDATDSMRGGSSNIHQGKK